MNRYLINKTFCINILYIIISGLIFSIFKSYNFENGLNIYNIIINIISVAFGIMILVFTIGLLNILVKSSPLVNLIFYYFINYILLFSIIIFISSILDFILMAPFDKVKKFNSTNSQPQIQNLNIS